MIFYRALVFLSTSTFLCSSFRKPVLAQQHQQHFHRLLHSSKFAVKKARPLHDVDLERDNNKMNENKKMNDFPSVRNPIASSKDLDALISNMNNRPVVMLGEASHGTHEFYTWRAALSKRLIVEQGYNFIAVEGDWPDCYRINRYVKGYPDAGTSAREVLTSFDRWPTWMWANWEIVSLIEWLKEYNQDKPEHAKIGFYGLDVYSLWESMKEILSYLEKEDPNACEYVKSAIQCFQPYEENEQLYARLSWLGGSCREKLVTLLKEVRSRMPTWDGDSEDSFNIEQNAIIALNAEEYYHSMVAFNNTSWNVRDTHMMETLDRLLTFYDCMIHDGQHDSEGSAASPTTVCNKQMKAKCIIWEHNTHIGDARATDMADDGMVNIGQLAREKYDRENVYLVGFGSYSGSVIAGSSWGAEMQELTVPPAQSGSLEHELHSESSQNRFLLLQEEDMKKRYALARGHRAIGVVYNPKRERGNYVPSRLSDRYDAFIFLDKTRALHPLHMAPHHEKIPETYPFGF